MTEKNPIEQAVESITNLTGSNPTLDQIKRLMSNPMLGQIIKQNQVIDQLSERKILEHLTENSHSINSIPENVEFNFPWTEVPTFRFALNDGLDSSFLPTRGTEKATGWDVRSAETVIIHAGDYAKIDLGFRALCPDGWWLELRPRSSSFAKKNLHCLYGVIDEDYEGKMVFACQFNPAPSEIVPGTQKILSVLKGEALGQLVPVRRQEMTVEQVSNEDFDRLCKARAYSRGAGGFGSTTT